MSKGNPYSALYYIKENKGKSILCIFMMFLATLMFLTGNYIQSVLATFDKDFLYGDTIVRVNMLSTDEKQEDFKAFSEMVEQDERLKSVKVTGYGFGSLTHSTVLGFEMSGSSYVFRSLEDMENVFARLNIEGDFSSCGHRSIIISKELAKNRGIELGDTIDHAFDPNLDGAYTVDALIDDGGYCTFYIFEDDDNLVRLYIYSDSMEGKELYDYVRNLAGDKRVQISETERDVVLPQLSIFYIVFYIVDILIAIVLAVTVNSVVTGQYLKRTYEFGVYRALGRSKKDIWKKVAAEILIMNLFACALGFCVMFLYTYLVNELYYTQKGLHLLYASKAGFFGLLICETLIVLPLIFAKAKKMSRADVTQF
ncbi:MAG: ABC transporter permease [Lachnospiraceae bacterium]|nr:ABC transporter permease [Lachnospiraceae bacterium]